MVFLSIGDVYVGELLELPQGCQGPFRGSSVKVGFLLRCRSGKGPHLALRGESPDFSRVATGILGFLSSYDAEFREPLVLPREIPVSMQVVRCFSGLLSIWCWVLGPHLEVRPEHRVPLQCFHGSWGSYGVSTRESGHVSCGDMRVCFSL